MSASGGDDSRDVVTRRGEGCGKGESSDRRRVVLSEETYQRTLTSIVTRDYYPSIPSLRRDLAVLDCRRVGDMAGAIAVRRAARKLAEEEESDRRLRSCPSHAVGLGERRPARLDQDDLSGFHARAASEDNAEFEELQAEELLQRQEHWNQVFGAPQQKAITAAPHSMLLASDQFNPSPRSERLSERKTSIEISCARPSLFFTPPHVPPSQQQQQQQQQQNSKKNRDASLAGDASHKINAEQSEMDSFLMPPPPAVDSRNTGNGDFNRVSGTVTATHDPTGIISEVHGGDMEYQKRIVPSRTRFMFQNESRLPPSSSARRHEAHAVVPSSSNCGDASDTDASTDLDATPLSLRHERAARDNVLSKQKYDFIPMTPLVHRNIPDDVPFDTNNTIESEESLLPTFVLPPKDEREVSVRKAEQKLAKRGRQIHSKSTRKQKERKVESFVVDRAASLTPAARSLLEKRTSVSGSISSTSSLFSNNVRGSFDLGSALRSTYHGAATPRANPSITTTSSSLGSRQSKGQRRQQQPMPKGPHRGSVVNNEKSLNSKKGRSGNITDGLLQLGNI
eukprot:scaffold112_cov57-Attheya_sp.AAC.4